MTRPFAAIKLGLLLAIALAVAVPVAGHAVWQRVQGTSASPIMPEPLLPTNALGADGTLRLDVADGPDQPRDGEADAKGADIVVTGNRALGQGEAAVLHFRIRADLPADARANAVVEVRARPAADATWNEKILARLVRVEIPLTSGWQDWTFSALGTPLSASSPVEVEIQTPPRQLTLELADLTLQSWGSGLTRAELPSSRLDYAGRDPAAPWRVEAEARIERLRKGDLVVHVEDAAGQPLVGAHVSVHMTRHAFGFGAVLHPDVLDQERFAAHRDQYRATFLKLFNRAVLANEMKWPQWDKPGMTVRIRGLVDELAEQGVRVRGHCMVWPGTEKLPKPVLALLDGGHDAELRQAVLDHIRDIGTTYRGRVVDWDVQNEPFNHHRIQDRLGPDVQVDWFEAARAADPSARLSLNENGTLLGGARTDTYLGVARLLLDHGAPLDALAEQAHFAAPQSIDDLQAGFDRLAALGLPIVISEFDVVGVDEAAQADFLRDFYTLAFSQPAVTDILTWGFWEGVQREPSRAMFRADWTPKPSALAYEDLVLKRWWTDEDLTTQADGSARLRGFRGDYTVTVEQDGRTVTRDARIGGTPTEVGVVLR